MELIKKIIPAIPILISLLALYLSLDANTIARDSREDSRKLSKLHMDPNIRLSANLDSKVAPSPSITVFNDGPVQAVQVEIELYELRYDKNIDNIKAMTSGGDAHWKIDELAPGVAKNFVPGSKWFNADYYRQLSNAEHRPIEHYVFEVLLSYRRQSDLRLYVKRAFYFLGADLRIVKEGNIQKNSSLMPVLLAAKSSDIDIMGKTMRNKMEADILHDITE